MRSIEFRALGPSVRLRISGFDSHTRAQFRTSGLGLRVYGLRHTSRCVLSGLGYRFCCRGSPCVGALWGWLKLDDADTLRFRFASPRGRAVNNTSPRHDSRFTLHLGMKSDEPNPAGIKNKGPFLHDLAVRYSQNAWAILRKGLSSN